MRQENIMAFAKATRKQAKLRLALTGPSGSGKTTAALLIAKGLGGKIACIDTERGSASLYSDIVDFDVQELAPPHSPEAYIAAVREAEAAGYDILIIDSASHEWNGVGGCLEINEKLAQTKFRGNTWSAWNETTPRHRKFIDALLQSNMHIICTGRSKTETAQTEENGKKKVTKLGMKTEQRDGFEYEFTVVLDLTHDNHYAIPSKDRTRLFMGDPQQITVETGKKLLAWLQSGAAYAPEPAQADTTDTGQTTGLGESEVEDHLAAIEAAESIENLQKAYVIAYKAATAADDSDALKRFTTAKDERKSQLSKKVA
jgi:hypothetical protein